MSEHMDPELKKAILHLWEWQYDPMGSFFNYLYVMFQKADNQNKLKLGLGFPEHFLAYRLWENSESQEAFFKQYLPESEQWQK